MPIPTNRMVYQQRQNAYVGKTRNGREVHVDAAEVAERIQLLAKANGIDLRRLQQTDRDTYDIVSARYRDMNLDPDTWAGMDTDGNKSVRTYCAQCGCQSAVPESVENGTPAGCTCRCHDKLIALGLEE